MTTDTSGLTQFK